jgi:hypothetical protein
MAGSASACRHGRTTSATSAFPFLDGDVIAGDAGSVAADATVSLRREHMFAPKAFTSLRVNQATAKMFDHTPLPRSVPVRHSGRPGT